MLKHLDTRCSTRDGTYKWYAPDDVKGSQLNNVIINSLPITSKTLNLKVDGKNLTGNSPKVERGTTVQLCASCNAKDADVTFSILRDGRNNAHHAVGQRCEIYDSRHWQYQMSTSRSISSTMSAATRFLSPPPRTAIRCRAAEKTLTVTKPNFSNAEITFPDGNEAAFNYCVRDRCADVCRDIQRQYAGKGRGFHHCRRRQHLRCRPLYADDHGGRTTAIIPEASLPNGMSDRSK